MKHKRNVNLKSANSDQREGGVRHSLKHQKRAASREDRRNARAYLAECNRYGFRTEVDYE